MSRPDAGDTGWLALAAYVIAFDAWAITQGRTTLSASFTAALASPHRRWPTIALWAYLTAHLHGLLPDRYDPLRKDRA